MKTINKPFTYDVVWIVNGVIKEHIAYNKPKALANWIKNKAKSSTHTTGEIKLIKN